LILLFTVSFRLMYGRLIFLKALRYKLKDGNIRSILKKDESILSPQINEHLMEDVLIEQKELVNGFYKLLKVFNTNATMNIKESLLAKYKEPLRNIKCSINEADNKKI
jgi:hypothetical protein